MGGKEVTAVILAGGRGDRMGELTQDLQKCMLPVRGKPILGYVLDNIQEAFGSARIIIATGHKPESIREFYGNRYRNIDIEYVHNPERLETRKRLQLAQDLIKGPFLYLAGDVISDPAQLIKVVESYEKERGNGLMGVISAAIDHQPALNHALITVENGHAIEMLFPATPTWTSNQVREMGIAYYDSQFFYLLKNAKPDQTYLSNVITEAISRGVDFAVENYFNKWYHFFRPQDLQTEIRFNKSKE